MILSHENEEEIYGDIPIAFLDIVTSVDSPNLRLALEPGQLRSGWRVDRHEGYSLLRSCVACTCGSRMRCSPTARSWWLARVTASWWRSCGRSATTASTGSSPWSRISTSQTKFGELSGPELFTVPCGPSRHLKREGIQYA